MLRLYKSSSRRGRRRATIKRSDAEAIQIKGQKIKRMEKGDNKQRADAEAIRIKGPQSEERGDNKEIGCRGCTNHGVRRARRRAKIKRADGEATQIKGPQREATIKRSDADPI